MKNIVEIFLHGVPVLADVLLIHRAPVSAEIFLIIWNFYLGSGYFQSMHSLKLFTKNWNVIISRLKQNTKIQAFYSSGCMITSLSPQNLQITGNQERRHLDWLQGLQASQREHTRPCQWLSPCSPALLFSFSYQSPTSIALPKALLVNGDWGWSWYECNLARFLEALSV